ncbi:MAG: DUF6090 family protein [Bacteroidetes bacterium]|nr:DUF6090 family protein [Bacteroidota bacterium]
MIKLFRNNRKKMLDKGNFHKYILYAIGEIILVVVGILIALSINNWNNNKLDRKAELQIYKNIKSQILDDQGLLNGNIDYNNLYLEQYHFAQQIIAKNDRSKIDTLRKIAFNLYRYSDLNRNSNIYQTIVNSGELKLLKNLSILENLQRLEVSYIYLNRMEEIHFKVILRYVGPGVIDNINFSTGVVDRPDELYSFDMQNLFFLFSEIMNEKDEIYRRTLVEINIIIKLIDEELYD